MKVLVSSNEWGRFKTHLGEEGIPTTQGFDFLIFSKLGPIAVERKRFPADLLASAEDGRLARECTAMREEASFRFLVCEGRASYTQDGHVKIGKRPSHWTRTGVRSLLRSVRFVEGVDVEFTTNTKDTAQLLQELVKYFSTEKHGSYRTRPSFSPDFYVETKQERLLYWVQGLPGVKLTRAEWIVQAFPTPMAVVSANLEDWKGIRGIGDKTARRVWEFLHGDGDRDVDRER